MNKQEYIATQQWERVLDSTRIPLVYSIMKIVLGFERESCLILELDQELFVLRFKDVSRKETHLEATLSLDILPRHNKDQIKIHLKEFPCFLLLTPSTLLIRIPATFQTREPIELYLENQWLVFYSQLLSETLEKKGPLQINRVLVARKSFQCIPYQ